MELLIDGGSSTDKKILIVSQPESFFDANGVTNFVEDLTTLWNNVQDQEWLDFGINFVEVLLKLARSEFTPASSAVVFRPLR